MNFILIEDDNFKQEKIINFLTPNFESCKIKSAESVSSAIELLKIQDCNSTILLDMSLPTYDQKNENDSGRPQGFGGIEILRYMEFIEDYRKVIVITQFDTFVVNGECIEVSDIELQLKNEFPDKFIGLVQFDVVSDAWKEPLLQLISESKN